MTPGPRGRSLFWTISGMFLLAVVLGTLVQVFVAVAVLRPLEAREARARAEVVASGLAADIATAAQPLRPTELDSLLAEHRSGLGNRPGLIAYRSPEGQVHTAPPERGRFLARALAEHGGPGGTGREGGGLEGGPPGRPLPPEAQEGDRRGPPRGPAEPHEPGPPGRFDLVVRRPVVRGPEQLGEVFVVRPLRPPGFLFQSQTALLFFPIAVIVSVLMGFALVRMLVRRLRAMEMLAARVADGDLTVRIGDARGDEIGRLAQRLDRMTERLAEARARVEATEQQRRQLFADITHELATPLTSIRGYAETLLDPGVPKSDDERGRFVRGVLEEARRLDRLIRDLFELARLEAGASPLEKETLDWAALCRNTAERFEPRFRAAGLALVWREPPPEAWIEADGHRLEQVLENLLVNALRYVPAGGEVTLALEPAPASEPGFRLVVTDDGPGLPPAELAHVFERFYRAAGAPGADAASDRAGSGLGLAIVREIVQRHGGTVSARSLEPRGLAITIALPARTSPGPAPGPIGR